jgi:radical SAM superfamily enzyme YgiQ (UPF0313 family)
MKLLLINPRSPESFWSMRWATDTILPSRKALSPPLGLATVAALTPASWQITIVDENIESVPSEPDADLIGIGGTTVQFERQAELLRFYRERGYTVVAGGSYASLCPEKYDGLADIVVAGEAEGIWQELCDDLERGATKKLYRESGKIPLEESPVPRFDLLQLGRYAMASLQLSRGCPTQCEFCDTTLLFGARQRTKSLEQIDRELDLLRSLGAREVFFADDNFIENESYAKAVLRHLVEYQQRHRFSFRFGSKASVSVAGDDEFLRLLRAANFQWLLIGIETGGGGGCSDAGEPRNRRATLLDSVHHIYSYGIDVLGGVIIGFDDDSPEAMEEQYRFILDSGIQLATVDLLQALPGTPLYHRLAAEGRIVAGEADGSVGLTTNLIPKRMERERMISGCERLYRRLTTDTAIELRIRAKLHHFRPRRGSSGYSWREELWIVARFIRYGLLPGGWRRLLSFWRSIGGAAPRTMHTIMSEWISGLSMQEFLTRGLPSEAKQEGRGA